MEFRTKIEIKKTAWHIEPDSRLLLVGSCFADEMGQRFLDNQFHAVVNPYGVMYNPASILHSIKRTDSKPDVAILTLGTSHVYRLKETGEIVDNCQKRPHSLFSEEVLTVDECADYLQQAVDLLTVRNPQVHIIMTVSPIRYAKYGFHGSRLSKATLLLAAEKVIADNSNELSIDYFPAYEIMNDELRDYRFHAPDMIHPTQQAIDYIWQRLAETCFSERTHQFLAEWQPICQALNHRPFHPDSDEYRRFLQQTEERLSAFKDKYGI